MATLNGLPVYKIRISESLENKTGVDFISLVDYPAIETNWVAMAQADKKIPGKFTFNEDQKLLYGPALIPDMPIYRFDQSLGEYYVVFTKEEILKIVRKFQKQNKNLNLNYQHQPDSQIKAVIQESWLTGKSDKSKDMGFDLPEGTWFVCTHVEDEKFWSEQVKSGNVRGYSIEGWLDMEMRQVKRTLGKVQKYETIKRAQNNDLYISGAIQVGNYVYYDQPQIVLIGTEQQELRTPIWESDVELADGRVLVLEYGKIIQIIEKAAVAEYKKKKNMSKSKFTEAKTKDGLVIKTDAETMAIGVDVYTMDGEKKTPVPDGEYTLENGTVIKCAGGKITDLAEATEQDEELSPEEVAVIQKALKPILDKYEARIKDLEAKLENTPGAGSATDSSDDKNKGGEGNKSPIKTAMKKLEILRKKSTEVSSTKK